MKFVLSLVGAALSLAAQPGFYPFAVDQDRLSGAPDYSFLNHPLTAADLLFVRDGHFYRAGADLKLNTRDDERVRLFGVNLAFGGNFPEAQDAPRIAKRLRRLGVNLVRLHHMDSSPDAVPENARSILTTGPYPAFNPVTMERLRRFLDALKAEGIYVNLNLHVGYPFRPEVDRVPAMPDGARWPTQGKPLHIFYPRMVELQVKYTRELIAGLKLKGDPVLGMVEIDNETSLLEAWGRNNLDKFLLGEYRAEWLRQWRAFRKSDADAPLEGDRYVEFLADRDRAYLRSMLEAVRASAGAHVPVAGTQMGYGGLLNLDTHADLDYQDNHYYIDHYNFPRTPWDSRDWRIRDSSSVGSGMTTFLNMAAAREAGKPYTVSEFNQPWPNRQAAECDPTIAAFGAFQDWDALMHFAYSHGRAWDAAVPSSFDINSDWGKWPNLGQSAWLFRSGAIQPGRSPVTVPVTREMQLEYGRQKRVGAVSAYLNATAGYDPAVAFVHPVGLRKADTRPAPAAALASPYRADTGELVYDRDRRTYTIQTPKAAGATGYFTKVSAGAVDIELVPTGRGFATILVTSLDGRPLGGSRRMLLSTPGYTLATVARSEPPRMQKLVNYPGTKDWWTLEPDAGSDKPAGNRSGGVAPVQMERVESFVTLRTRVKGLAVYPLDGAGLRLARLGAKNVAAVAGGVRIHLQAEGQALAPWYEIVAER